jgi:hypothetical protein
MPWMYQRGVILSYIQLYHFYQSFPFLWLSNKITILQQINDNMKQIFLFKLIHFILKLNYIFVMFSIVLFLFLPNKISIWRKMRYLLFVLPRIMNKNLPGGFAGLEGCQSIALLHVLLARNIMRSCLLWNLIHYNLFKVHAI